MYGKDIENIIKNINDIYNTAVSCMQTVAGACGGSVRTQSSHAGEGYGSCYPSEISVSMPNISTITSIWGKQTWYTKLKKIQSEMYTNSNEFNNSIGSPWTEVDNLKKVLDMVSSRNYGSYSRDIAGIGLMLSQVTAACVDAKWAIITYNVYIQRGFDTIFNGSPSVTFKTGLNKTSMGNINQNIDENINIKKKQVSPY